MSRSKRMVSMLAATCLLAAMTPAMPAHASSSVQLTATAQIEYVSVTLETTNTLVYGTASQSTTVTKSFTARNNGSLAADWDMIATDATDTAGDCWSLGQACGPDKFAWVTSGTGVNPLSLSTSWQRVADGVPADSTKTVALAFTFPSSAKSSLVHKAVTTLRATVGGGPGSTTQSITFDNTPGTHQTLTASANKPIDVSFDPSTTGCSANIHFTTLSSPQVVKTSAAGQNVTYHSDGLPAGTYPWKCSMMNCCYGTLVVQ
jgi:hypothetical protein